MKPTILALLLLFAATTNAQFNELILRKNGIAKKRYAEGATITLQTKLGLKYTGIIYLIQNDSIYFLGDGIHKNDIAIVFKKQKKKHRFIPLNTEAFLYTNLGIPLFTAGLFISGEPFLNSLLSGVGLVYIPVLLYNAQQLVFNRNKKYRIGNKYDLQVLDFYPSEKLPGKKQ
jgi:hypothetical protein